MKSSPCARLLPFLLLSMARAGPALPGEPVVYEISPPLGPGEEIRDRASIDKKTVAAGSEIEGDALIANGRIAVLLRKADGRAVLSSVLGGEFRECGQVAAAAGQDLAIRFTSIHVDPVGPAMAGVTVRAETGARKAISFRCRVTGERPIVEWQPAIEPASGATGFSLSYRSGHAILPEIFGDDLVLRAGGSEDPLLRLPGDHAVLHPVGRGDAILLVNWPPGPKEIVVHAGKAEGGPIFLGTDVPCAGPEKLWTSILAGAAIWQEIDAARFTFSEYRKLDWKPPFPARYRADLHKEGPWDLTDSWMRQSRKDKFWMAFLGNGFPPLTIEGEEASVRIPRFRPGLPFPKGLPQEIQYSGPILIYPFARETEAKAGRTPEGERTVLDLLRATLGEGWVQALDIGEGVLQVEPYPKGFVFMATCGATGIAEGFFSKGKEKEEEAAIRRAFDEMNRFVGYHRERIEQYVAYAAACRKRIEEFERSYGSGAGLGLEDLERLLPYFADLFEQSREAIQTPERCKELTEKVIALIELQDPDKVKEVKELGVAIRTIGGRQDDMLCGYRMTAKAIRQRAGQMYAVRRDPSARELLRSVRGDCRSILRITSPYEEFLFLTAARLAEKQ